MNLWFRDAFALNKCTEKKDASEKYSERIRYSINIELFDYVSKNSKFIFSFELIDSSNQKIESKLYEYWRIGTVSYPVNSYGKIIPSTFNPNLDMNGILITHPTAINETNSQIEI